MEKLFGVEISYKLGRIQEFDIIKETDKTYVVCESGRNHKGWTVRKSTMEVCFWHFKLTYEEALEYKKQLIKERISDNEKKIAGLQEENIKLKKALEENAN